MVDLVKIRKRAREQKEAGSTPAGEQAPESNEETRGTQVAGPASGGRSSTERVDGDPGKTPAPKARKASKKVREKSVPETNASEQASPSTNASPAAAEPSNGPDSEESPATSPLGSPAVTPDAAESGESRLNRFKRTAGVIEDRIEQETSEEEEVSDEDLLEVITFNLAGEQYAMDVDHLVEIIVPRNSTRVPNASEEVIGILSLRGSIVTLLDLRRILKHPGRGEETEDTRIVVVQHENEKIGFIVDKVLRVVKVDPASIEAQPVVSSAEHDDVVRGVFVSGDTITIYLDLQRIAADQGAS